MVEEILHLEDNKHMILLFPFTLHDKLANLGGKKAFKCTSIEQLKSSY